MVWLLQEVTQGIGPKAKRTTMIQRKTSSQSGEAVDTISSFLASPPEGTPAEVIEAFDALGTKQYLPPKLFLETVEQAPIAISITDPTARILYVNRAFEALTGYTRDEVVGKNESVLSSKSTPIEVYEALWETLHDRRVWQGTLVNHRKSKQEYLAELVISPVLNKQGQVAYYLGMHRDITAVHQLEQRLKFQKSLTEAALDAAPVVGAWSRRICCSMPWGNRSGSISSTSAKWVRALPIWR